MSEWLGACSALAEGRSWDPEPVMGSSQPAGTLAPGESNASGYHGHSHSPARYHTQIHVL